MRCKPCQRARIKGLIIQLKQLSASTRTTIGGKEIKSWITIKGNHIPVFEGESNGKAFLRFLNEQDKKEKSSNKVIDGKTVERWVENDQGVDIPVFEGETPAQAKKRFSKEKRKKKKKKRKNMRIKPKRN